ncbi:hypothetical protein BH11MYX2_BH11MYX2_30600 [soil metagenome]
MKVSRFGATFSFSGRAPCATLRVSAVDLTTLLLLDGVDRFIGDCLTESASGTRRAGRTDSPGILARR